MIGPSLSVALLAYNHDGTAAFVSHTMEVTRWGKKKHHEKNDWITGST